LVQINIMFTRFSAFYSPLIATMAGGFLKEEGLEPSFSISTPDKTTVDALKDGTVHVGQSAVSYSWGLLANGELGSLVHFAQVNERDGFFLTARQSDPDFTWNKLVGKTVLADHGGQPLAMFKYGLHRQGVDFGDIDVINAGSGAAMEEAFRSGTGDYIHQQGPAPQQLEVDGVGHIVACVGNAVGPVAFSSLLSTREWLESETARACMRAYVKARQYVNNTPAAEIAAAEKSFFDDVDKDALTRTIEYYQGLGNWNPKVEISRDDYEVALDVFEYSNLIDVRYPYEEVIASPPI